MSNRTPGNWSVFDNGDGVLHVSSDNGSLICFIHSDEESVDADADLIAAAPESHEANCAFVRAMEDVYFIEPHHTDERIYDEMPSSQLALAYFAARAAIAKATGRT